MASINVSNLAGTVALLLVYAAFNPLITEILSVLLPQLGQVESLILRAIPVFILLAIASNTIQEEPEIPTGRGR